MQVNEKPRSLEVEVERICESLLSTYSFWEEKQPKDKYKVQLQTCFRLALELGILIGTERRLGVNENEEIRIDG